MMRKFAAMLLAMVLVLSCVAIPAVAMASPGGLGGAPNSDGGSGGGPEGSGGVIVGEGTQKGIDSYEGTEATFTTEEPEPETEMPEEEPEPQVDAPAPMVTQAQEEAPAPAPKKVEKTEESIQELERMKLIVQFLLIFVILLAVLVLAMLVVIVLLLTKGAPALKAANRKPEKPAVQRQTVIEKTVRPEGAERPDKTVILNSRTAHTGTIVENQYDATRRE